MSCTYNYNIQGKLMCNEYFVANNKRQEEEIKEYPGDISYNFSPTNENNVFVWNGSLFAEKLSQYFIKEQL